MPPENASVVGLVGGYGSGKTQVSLLKMLDLCLHDSLTIAAYSATYDLLREVNFRRFAELLSSLNINYSENRSTFTVELYANGHHSRVIFRSMDKPQRIIAYDSHYSFIDELDTLGSIKAQDVFQRILARNRKPLPDGRPNKVWISSTPEGYGFLYQVFQREPRPGYVYFRCPTALNFALPDHYADELKKLYSPELCESYLEGFFTNLQSGSVYKFDREENDTTRQLQKQDQVIHVGLDFNVGKMAAVVAVIDEVPTKKTAHLRPHDHKKMEIIQVVAEHIDILDTPEMIKTLKNTYRDKKIIIYPDASGRQRKSQGASMSDINLLEKNFSIRVDYANPAVKDRVNATNAAFRNGESPPVKRLFINTSQCPRLAEGLEQQGYDVNGQPDKDNTFEHANDALSYLVHQRMPIDRSSIKIIGIGTG